MALFCSAAVLGLSVHRANFQKREPVSVQPRAFHSLTLRLSGAVRLWVDGKELLSQAPCITYMPKGRAYRTEVLEDGELIAVHFTMTPEAENALAFVYSPEYLPRYENQFCALLAAARPCQAQDYAALSLFYGLLALLQSDLDARQPIAPRILQARLLLEKRYCDPQLSVSSLASELDISGVYLRRQFKAAFGVSPIAYLQSLRIENAKSMLRTGYYTVSQVARESGYESLSYFSAAFRRHTGAAPSDFLISSPFL